MFEKTDGHYYFEMRPLKMEIRKEEIDGSEYRSMQFIWADWWGIQTA